MRTRKEIGDKIEEIHSGRFQVNYEGFMLEVLLDIRDLLTPNPGLIKYYEDLVKAGKIANDILEKRGSEVFGIQPKEPERKP